MFKELLCSKNEIEKHSTRGIGSEINKIDKSQLKFQTILCPKSNQSFSTKQCKTCPHMIEHQRAHKSGYSMVTTICRFSAKNPLNNE